MRKKLFTFLLALVTSVGLSWAIPTEFAYCYDCQREPAFPTTSESCALSDFDWPMVGNNSSIGPWKIEFVEYYNSSSTEYDFSINSDLADLYEKTPEQMEIYRLYQWNESAGEYQHAAYGVLCAYANESNPVEHAALFVADGRWGCYLTGEVHNGGSINITFDEDAKTGFGDLHPAPNPHGECGAQGDNLLWELDPSTGVLTITGSGAMKDWTYDTDRPWYSLRAQITSVVLPSGITTLGKYAFRGTDIVSINMTENYPAGLTTINQEAFFSTQLTSVTIPESVVTIGMDAFRESKTITDVYCYADPNNLTWNDYYCDDFKNADHATVCHVKACALSTYEANWGGTPYNVFNSTGVNVTFVGDLPGDCPAPTPTDEQVPTNADPENPSYHYSTFFHSTQNYKLSNDGTQAFIADLSNNDLVLTEIAHGEQVIPANTAVILRKTGSADPVVLVPTEENGAIINPDDNSLEGVDVATPIASKGLTRANCYVLSGQQGVGFYLINSDYLKAHKAYVKYAGSSSNAPKKMRFVYGQATGIEDVQGNNVQSTKVIENGVLYIIRDGKTYNAMGQMVK